MKLSSSKLQRFVPYLSILLAIVNIKLISQLEAQVISHELRRLAISTNQFGIDALKALDRIEPPDKVIVFSPICLSSSLMMIMMGSSKYQVVSSLKQALYVWPMKPSEINRGFKDIFDHVGLNQHPTTSKTPMPLILDSTIRSNSQRRSFSPATSGDDDLTGFDSENHFQRTHLSLPKLMQIKELVDRSINEGPDLWWKSINRGHARNVSRNLKATVQYSPLNRLQEQVSNIIEERQNQPTNQTLGERGQRNLSEGSQMNAISNIYIQRGLNMNYNYNLLLRQYYKTVIHPVDFLRNAEETRLHINSLVSSNTEGKIKDLVKKSAFESVNQPKIMIISTFHFRATLDVQIKTQDTGPEMHNSSSKPHGSVDSDQQRLSNRVQQTSSTKQFIETEESLLKFGMFTGLDCSVVEIPFNNRLVSLIIVMPNNHNSTELLITRLNAQVLSDMVNSLIVKRLSIEIPIIKFDRGPINVEGLLKELGLNQYFFGGSRIQTTETGLNKWMRPSDIVHETSIDIGTINPNFQQTEDRLKAGAHDDNQSAASTSTSTNTKVSNNNSLDKLGKRRMKRSRDVVDHIKLDKPFLYFVFDSINGLVLTMGRIRQQ